MSEKTNGNMQITNIFNNELKGDALSNALNFAAFVTANGIATGEGQLTYDGQAVCYFHVDGKDEMPGPWTIWTEGDYASAPEGFPINQETKETAWANINICGSCGGSCSPGETKTVFGKEFDGVCGAIMAFTNPGKETQAGLFKILEMRMHVIRNP
ncbi:MAG: hypothetical protein FWE42_03635 [Defluviitaleaceae bacterium]|nr:hypothetical protein [Defluviitaleaceae bacterium]